MLSEVSNTSIPTDVANNSAKSGGLSTGAIAGTAVGCDVVGLVVIGFVIWFILRHRRRRNEQLKPEVPPLAASPEPPSPRASGWALKEAAVTSTRESSRSRREQGEHITTRAKMCQLVAL